MRHTRSPLSAAVSLISLISLSTAGAAGDWPQFRGADATGVSREPGLPDRWDRETNVAWSVTVPGSGWSSPVVSRGRVFVTTAVGEVAVVEPKKGLYPGSSAVAQEPLTWAVLCYDLETGALRWRRDVHRGVPENPVHGKNTYASETPVVDGERVYAYFGGIGLFAFDLDGEPAWDRRFDPVRTRLGWGTAASPTLGDGRIYLLNDNETRSWLEAIDVTNGESIWSIERAVDSNWATPFLWKNELRTELVTAGTEGVISYDRDGNELWILEGMSSITIATPYAANGLLYVSSGMVMDRVRPMYAIRPGAAGDITLDDGETTSEFVAWCRPKIAPYNPTTIVVGERLYVLLDRGILAGYDALTGATVYEKQRLGVGPGYTSSPWSVDGKLFCLDEDGRTTVLRCGDTFEILHTNDLEEMCMASPAIADGNLLIRTMTKLYCIRRPAAPR